MGDVENSWFPPLPIAETLQWPKCLQLCYCNSDSFILIHFVHLTSFLKLTGTSPEQVTAAAQCTVNMVITYSSTSEYLCKSAGVVVKEVKTG